LALSLSAAAGANPNDKITAEALFEAGRAAMERGDFATACAKFEESNRLDPAVGTLLNLANCKERLGELATAWVLFREAAQRLPAGDARQPVAHKRADALRQRIPRLVVSLGAGAPEGTRVVRDGAELGAASLGVALPLDPGRHVITVSAPNHEQRRYAVELKEGERTQLSVVPGAPLAVAKSRPKESASLPIASAPPKPESLIEGQPDTLSHAGQLGSFVRADIDPAAPGLIVAPGISYGVGDWVSLAGAGLIGSHAGVELGLTLLIGTGSLKPRATLAAPVFFVDGAAVGVRAGAGVTWDTSRHFGLFGELGGAGFPSPPEEHSTGAFLVVAGAEARL
jgi:hypothetical protein